MNRFLTAWKQRSATLAEARQAAFKPSVWLLVPIFLLVFLVAQLASLIVAVPAVLPDVLQHGPEAIDQALNGPKLWGSLFATIPVTAVFIFYMKRIERRSYLSMGFTRGGTAKRYLQGLGWGFAMCIAALGIAWALGGMRFEGFTGQIPWGMLLLLFVGFLFQGMSEEVVCRSFLMVSAANRAPLWIAVALNSLIFAAMHLANSGVTFFSFANLVLYGVFASFYFLRTDNVWGIAALHTAWNFTQGSVLGVEVSGHAIQDRLMHFGATDAPDMLSGGKFGLEGGVATTIVYLAGILILVFWPDRQQQAEKENS